MRKVVAVLCFIFVALVFSAVASASNHNRPDPGSIGFGHVNWYHPCPGSIGFSHYNRAY